MNARNSDFCGQAELGRFGRNAKLTVSLLASLAGAVSLLACGPDFPNNLLRGGDAPLLVAPECFFVRELTRMNLLQSRFEAVESTNTYAAATTAAELNDLRAALRRAKAAGPEIDQICTAHAAARDALEKYIAQRESWECSRSPEEEDDDDAPRVVAAAPAPPPPFPHLELTAGLPPEFADYFEGALAWHDPALVTKDHARSAWERLLGRPATERRFKSTWAAFMLGKSWENTDPEKALGYFKQVRELARKGFVDSLGLAVASLGLEGRVYLRQTNYARAIELYLEQFATGDSGAAASLRFVAAQALKSDPATLEALARDARAQRVLTAYLVSEPLSDPGEAEGADRSLNHARRWLAAVESAGIRDLDSAEKLALAAYRVNQMDLAQRWIKRAPNAPVAQWLEAKLLLRAGKLDQAARLLARVAPLFPVEARTNEVPRVALKDALYVPEGSLSSGCVPVERQVLGELGALRLARREYAKALDALLNAGFWMDAAYVAERVLTVDELKKYVDSHWPAVSANQVAEETEQYGEQEISPARLREQIRYLLARRLARAFRSHEARQYYPAQWLAQFDEFVRVLGAAWDESLPSDQRARAFFAAAWITRTNGMELIGTEVEPDWHIHQGDFEEGVWLRDRLEPPAASVVLASADELSRAAQHVPEPPARFHYRYQAAALAWEAARLMPDNSDETARVLWTAGTWLKNRDPKTADFFYKALVRRNRKTALGAEADRRRWFPPLDQNGNIIPRSSPTPEPASDPGELRHEQDGTETPEMNPPDPDYRPPASEDEATANGLLY